MSKRWEFMGRLRAAWRILCGRAVMYRVKAKGPMKLELDQDLHVIKCQFE